MGGREQRLLRNEALAQQVVVVLGLNRYWAMATLLLC